MAKLLVVDDEAELCDFLKEVFARQNFQVFIATSGEEALLDDREGKTPGRPARLKASRHFGSGGEEG